MQAVTLLVLAGGMGSRFGGDKQLTTIGQTGKTLLHFSVLDAYDAGVRRLVLVIRPDLTALFQTQVLPGLPADLSVSLVSQQLSELPAGVVMPAGRQKPWGTAHALWVARAQLTTPFIVINADDYYGAHAMRQLVSHFQQQTDWAMVAYPLQQTLSLHGSVNRGICRVAGNLLQEVTECSGITARTENDYQGLDGQGNLLRLQADTLVSMNIWGFTPTVLAQLDTALQQFFALKPGDRTECYLPTVVDTALMQGQRLWVYQATEPWYGMTYQADLALLAEFFTDK